MIKKPFIPIAIIFLVASLLIFILKYSIKNSNSVFNPMILGNLVLYFATYISFNFYSHAITNNNTHTFLRMVYSAIFLKMIICIAAVLTYAFTFQTVSKTAILLFFGLYFIYTFVEVMIVMRLNKQKKNV